MSEKNYEPTYTDHDLLITIAANFRSFESNHLTLHRELGEKLNQILSLVSQKADKADVIELQHIFQTLEKRVFKIEQMEKVDDVKRQTALNLGAAWWKLWAGIGGIVLFLMEVFRFLKSFKF